MTSTRSQDTLATADLSTPPDEASPCLAAEHICELFALLQRCDSMIESAFEMEQQLSRVIGSQLEQLRPQRLPRLLDESHWLDAKQIARIEGYKPSVFQPEEIEHLRREVQYVLALQASLNETLASIDTLINKLPRARSEAELSILHTFEKLHTALESWPYGTTEELLHALATQRQSLAKLLLLSPAAKFEMRLHDTVYPPVASDYEKAVREALRQLSEVNSGTDTK